MKKAIFFAVIVLLAACKSRHNPPQDPPAPGTDVSFIDKDTANVMIESYLESISKSPDTQLNCLIINADSLRAYLDDTSIRNVKLMFAHTTAWINEGNMGRPARYKPEAFTMVLVGYNSSGDYVYYNSTQVMDNLIPCPNFCPSDGSAQYRTLSVR